MRTFAVTVDDTLTEEGNPLAGVVGVSEAARVQPVTTFGTATQSITFGQDLPTSFVEALIGLATGSAQASTGGHGVQISVFAPDWKSVEPARNFVLQSVVRYQDMGVAGLMLEPSEAYAFVVPADQEFTPISGTETVIIPSVRIARMHVP